MQSVYVSCFSQERDLLSQWRACADDGLGCAIGFDPCGGYQTLTEGYPVVWCDFAGSQQQPSHAGESFWAAFAQRKRRPTDLKLRLY
jgi:hypothetical protein